MDGYHSMKAVKKGFNLIEVMIYVLLSSLFIILATTFLCESWYTAHRLHNSLVAALNHYEVYHQLSQDGSSALPDTNLWDISPQMYLVMRCAQEARGWCVEKNILFRSVGRYNFATHTWVSKETDRMLEDVSEMRVTRMPITRISNETVYGIEFMYTHAGKKEKYIIPILEAYEDTSSE